MLCLLPGTCLSDFSTFVVLSASFAVPIKIKKKIKEVKWTLTLQLYNYELRCQCGGVCPFTFFTFFFYFFHKSDCFVSIIGLDSGAGGQLGSIIQPCANTEHEPLPVSSVFVSGFKLASKFTYS